MVFFPREEASCLVVEWLLERIIGMGLSYDTVQPGQWSFVVIVAVMRNHVAEFWIALASSSSSTCVLSFLGP